MEGMISMYSILNYDVLAVLGYAIVLNDEMHSNQIKWLEKKINDNNWGELSYLIYDVLNDKDEKKNIDSVFNALTKESNEIQLILYVICYQLILVGKESFSENEFNSVERNFLVNIENCISIKNLTKEKKKAKAEVFDCKHLVFKIKNNNNFSFDFGSLDSIASEDYNNLYEIINRLESESDLLYKKLSNLQYNITNSQLKLTLNEFRDGYKNKVFDAVMRMKDNIPQKELASKNFSLALMGRTKAGKSTLHTIMCQEGKEFIGNGSQRTTRYNRIFSWNGLKIIDTPGIGAGEENGKRDTEIAERVIGQADIICFVIVDDTISSEDILSTLDKIAEYHKPMVVVLNHKDDINKKSHMKKFCENPDDWRNTTNEKNLDGWIDRLKRNADQKGYKDILKVIPVFLLAAVKGQNEKNSLFFEKSNYPQFIEEIRDLIHKNCLIYKSQTLLDEPSIQLHKILTSLKKEQERLSFFKERIKKIEINTLGSIDSLQRNLIYDCLNHIEIVFDDFFTMEVTKFVETNSSISDVNVIHKNYIDLLDGCNVNTKICSRIEGETTEYHQSLSAKVKELKEEIKYADINTSGVFILDDFGETREMKGTFPIKGLLKFISMGLDLLAIWFPPLAAISFPVSFVSGFFKSKAQKEQINRENTKNLFRKFVEGNTKYISNNVRKELIQKLNEDKKSFSNFFSNLNMQIDTSLSYIEENRKLFAECTKKLDTYYAIRILEFITQNADEYSFNENNVFPYRNIEENYFEIRTKEGEFFDSYKIKRITGEKIKIRKYN